MRTEKKKTVFFLGAGFSCAAGAPSQKELLDKVINYSGYNYGNPVENYLDEIKMFFRDAFSLDDNKMKDFSLEDFYTPIDKCITQNSSFRGYSIDHIKKIRNELSILISIVIDAELTNSNKDQTYLDKFVDLIIEYIRINQIESPFLNFNDLIKSGKSIMKSMIYLKENNWLL